MNADLIRVHLRKSAAKKKSVAWTIMEPVILVPATLETQGSSPLARYQPCVYEEGL